MKSTFPSKRKQLQQLIDSMQDVVDTTPNGWLNGNTKAKQAIRKTANSLQKLLNDDHDDAFIIKTIYGFRSCAVDRSAASHCLAKFMDKAIDIMV